MRNDANALLIEGTVPEDAAIGGAGFLRSADFTLSCQNRNGGAAARCRAFGKLADEAGRIARRDRRLRIQGRIGSDRYGMCVVVERIDTV